MRLTLEESAPGEFDELGGAAVRDLAHAALRKALVNAGGERGGELQVVADLASAMTDAYASTLSRLMQKVKAEATRG